MSVSMKWVADMGNVQRVLSLSRRADMPMRAVAEKLKTPWHNVQYVLKNFLTPAEQKALTSLHHSYSKMGKKNPMKRKFGDAHHNWKGAILGKNSYITFKPAGQKRVQMHNKVLCDALGVKRIPRGWEVHHIDSDPSNFDQDNLALVTKKGHRLIHESQKTQPVWLKSKRLKLIDLTMYMTSALKKTRAI